MGRRRTREATTAMEILHEMHRRHHFRRWLLRHWAAWRSKNGAYQDSEESGQCGCADFNSRQQTRFAWYITDIIKFTINYISKLLNVFLIRRYSSSFYFCFRIIFPNLLAVTFIWRVIFLTLYNMTQQTHLFLCINLIMSVAVGLNDRSVCVSHFRVVTNVVFF